MMGAMTAGAGATGIRAWLGWRRLSWLTPRRMRALTVALLAGALLASSVVVGGSGPTSPAGGAGHTSAPPGGR